MLCFLIVMILCGQSLPVPMFKSPVCDDSRADYLQEGNIGESQEFPWLGMLRVHLHDYDKLKIAVTGLVLVKDRYAIANANDITRIPKHLFMQDSKAMFIPKHGEPWYTKPKDYMVHPEFEYSTYNTIALVELHVNEFEEVPFKPICWPGNFFNTSNHLYALGYTDENEHLEKTLYSLQYVKASLCKEFYNRAGFTEPKSAPTNVQCGFAPNNKNDCAWENGMALASNASGKWTLIGFGVRGPGCAAPARFIDMTLYLPWVESATDLEQIVDYRRQTAFDVGFRQRPKGGVGMTTEKPLWRVMYQGSYPGSTDDIYRIDQGEHQVYEMPLKLDELGIPTEEGCEGALDMVYREKMKLVDPQKRGGRIEYRVTVYDQHIHNYTCVKIKIKNLVSRSPVYVWFRHVIDVYEGTSFHGTYGETPSILMKYFPVPIREVPNDNKPLWPTGSHLEPTYLKDYTNKSGFININIALEFNFTGNVIMDLCVYGYAYPVIERPRVEKPKKSFLRRTVMDQQLPQTRRKNRLEKARERAAEMRRRAHAEYRHLGSAYLVNTMSSQEVDSKSEVHGI